MSKKLRSVELFAGAAGLGLGLAEAGFAHDLVVENNADACATMRLNQQHGHRLVEGWNILEASIEDVDLSAVKGDIDLLSGGPPCQGFSIGGRNQGHQDPRNLWPWTIAAVAQIQPRSFLFENVPNLASTHAGYLDYLMRALTLPTIAARPGRDGKTDDWSEDDDRLKRILESGQTIDPSYRVRIDTHVASDYGTGQKRKRLFIVGVRNDQTADYVPPKVTHSHDELMEDQWITGSYWDRHGIERPMPDEAAQRWIRQHNRRPRDLYEDRLAAHRTVRDVIASIPGDAPDNDPAPRDAKAYKGHTGSLIDQPAKTHRAGDHGVSGGEMMIDYGPGASPQYRHYSVREAAALSDFPMDYRFSGSWGDGLRQIGNAVPCALGRAIGGRLAQVLAA